MEDSFRVRMDKIFGSLEASCSSSSAYVNLISTSSSSSASMSSLWCLTGEEIQRREWKRDKGSSDDDDDDDDQVMKSSNLDHGSVANRHIKISSLNKPPDFCKELESDLQGLDDSGDEEEDENNGGEKNVGNQPLGWSSRQLDKPDDHNYEEWEIRSSVGLDCTLDYEEEEDAYDKVASGREATGDGLYMGDITDYEVDIDSNSVLLNTCRDITRDPRANHMAAKIRLKEDAEAAGDFDPSQLFAITGPSVNTQNNKMGDGIDLKSILKRTENQMATESKKRIRFEPGCKDDNEEDIGETKNSAMEVSPASRGISFLPQVPSSVPDYIPNPSKYTHYTFDSSSDDINEESNRKACMDFLNSLKGSNTMETQDVVVMDLPKSVMFTPKKKRGYGSMKNENGLKKNQEDGCKEYIHKKGNPLGIAAGNAQDGEVCAMEEEDEPLTAADRSSSLQKSGRRYRTKGRASFDELVN